MALCVWVCILSNLGLPYLTLHYEYSDKIFNQNCNLIIKCKLLNTEPAIIHAIDNIGPVISLVIFKIFMVKSFLLCEKQRRSPIRSTFRREGALLLHYATHQSKVAQYIYKYIWIAELKSDFKKWHCEKLLWHFNWECINEIFQITPGKHFGLQTQKKKKQPK